MCVCVFVCVWVCVCGWVGGCRESMNDVTVTAKNNFGDPWTPCIISPVLDQWLKTSDCY